MQTWTLLILGSLIASVLGGQYITYSYGGRSNQLYIPTASGSGPLPLFVMLHGCTQNPTDFATGTMMSTYCEQYNCFALFPEQPSSANMNKCWNWFETSDQARGSGEPQLIVSMAQSLFTKYQIDQTRIFVGGLSAGAAMTVILGATYPDFFRGACAGAGLEYQAATSMISAFTAMSSGGPNPVTQGKIAYQASAGKHNLLAIMVVHGTSDTTVAPINGQQIIDQFATTLDLDLGGGTANGYITDNPTTTNNGQVAGGRSYTVRTYVDSLHHQTLMTYVTVNGMPHAWSGGSSSGTYTDPTGPNASLMMVQYFLGFTNATNNGTTSASATTAVATTASATTSWTTSDGSVASGPVSTTTGPVSTTTGPATTTGTSGGGQSMTFTSISGEDGFVGQLEADGFSSSICQIGDKGMYNVDTYRTILSFDTTGLPAGASISSASLTITRSSLTGSLTDLIVDIKQGTFGSSTTLKQADYYATPSAANIGQIGVPSADGSTSTFAIPSSAFQYVPAGANGRCQFMIREDLVSTRPSLSAHNLQILDGASTLIVNYN